MTRTVFTQTLREQRRGLIGWSIAFALVPMLYLPSYRTLRDQGSLNVKQNKLYDALGLSDFASGAGYLGSTIYAMFGLVMMLIFAVTFAARSATQEENGSLDLLLAQPISRVNLLAQRFGALAAQVGVVTAVLTLGVLIGANSGGLGVAAGNIVAASIGLGLFALTTGTITLLAGAMTGSRSSTLGIGAVVGLGSYLANNLGGTIDGARWLRRLSPVYYANGNTPLVNGWSAHVLVLLGLTALAVSVAIAAFDRRDIAV
ncbi:ABC transporter permease subunit [Nocardia arthritidis]|nr:ABC transporter permease subunit [Nocardia arthritidis]